MFEPVTMYRTHPIEWRNEEMELSVTMFTRSTPLRD